ncbi:MAG: hypothetical protein WD470_04270 [Rhodospirillaceae bacterium]
METIVPPDRLSRLRRGTGPIRIDPAALRAAEAAVAQLEEGYSVWAQEDIDALRELAEAARGSSRRTAPAIAGIYRHALDMKGLAGGFGYDLLTSVAELLVRFMEGRHAVSPRDCDIVCAHIDAMQAILREDIRGDGREIGRELLSGLEMLVPAGGDE